MVSSRGGKGHRPVCGSQWRKAAALLAAGVAAPAMAVQFETDAPGLKVVWDNTVKYSNAFRVEGQSPALLANPNLDDGDRNFKKGLISNRLDLLSEFDLQYQDFGVRLSGAAWYDTIYNKRSDNDSPFTVNQTSVAFDQFAEQTRKLHGRKAEFLDAFAFGRFDLGDMRSTVRVGRHAVVWGESLFFGSNAIAGGMAPVDVTKLLSVPGTQFKEAIRPVPQISGQIQVSPTVTVGAYYQFRWEASRLPALGSYFSQGDTIAEGAQQMLLVSPFTPFAFNAPHDPNMTPDNGGQGGVQLRFNYADTDFGLYAIRYHNKTFQQVSKVGMNGAVVGPTSYHLAYHQGIKAYGFSASRTFGPANVAIEASVRTNQDLASSNAADVSFFGAPPADNKNNPGYAVGKTAHFNISTLWALGPTALFNEANFVAELAWNRVLSCSKNCVVYDPATFTGTIDPNSTRDAVALRVLFEPAYRQVLPGLDVSVPIGVGYSPASSRSRALGPGSFPPAGGGDLTIGLNGSYLDVWRFTLGYTHYFGGTKAFLDSNNNYSYGQSLGDRDFVAISVRRTF